ncbi:hypothetical protein HBI70_114930 [Parastagonospora nodorum]|nr:hypothetical protein HBI09_090600 [Parastagonospora nodorum]KAH4068743.1 hypothetical protein HBH50_118170 [Parastagonospora nodorum]KAH4100334.1 hypothetical protein HBH48_019710 [Parastagonospora nodorum]KAH4261710.1 hypothetical protein HBI03_115540 [Parastagonospora nodorum]KAH4422841.1 hypothetical protein HBH92_020080 [Parastagonospora nodorum]
MWNDDLPVSIATYGSTSPAQDKSYTRYHLTGSSASHTTTNYSIDSSHPVCLSSNNIPPARYAYQPFVHAPSIGL